MSLQNRYIYFKLYVSVQLDSSVQKCPNSIFRFFLSQQFLENYTYLIFSNIQHNFDPLRKRYSYKV